MPVPMRGDAALLTWEEGEARGGECEMKQRKERVSHGSVIAVGARCRTAVPLV